MHAESARAPRFRALRARPYGPGTNPQPRVGDRAQHQHAYVRLASGAELAVGELAGCGISHPCLAFEKWRLIPLVDDDSTVVGGICTFF